MLSVLSMVLALVVLTVVMVDTVRFGAPPMPSSPAERRAAVALVSRCHPSPEADAPAPGGSAPAPLRVVEAGAGWGGLAIALAQGVPGSRVTAVEGSWLPWGVCGLRAVVRRGLGRPSFRVVRGDHRVVELDHPHVVVAFLGPEPTAALARRLATDHSGVRLVSVGFAVPGWRKCARVVLDDAWRTEVALWAAPGSE